MVATERVESPRDVVPLIYPADAMRHAGPGKRTRGYLPSVPDNVYLGRRLLRGDSLSNCSASIGASAGTQDPPSRLSLPSWQGDSHQGRVTLNLLAHGRVTSTRFHHIRVTLARSTQGRVTLSQERVTLVLEEGNHLWLPYLRYLLGILSLLCYVSICVSNSFYCLSINR